MVQKAQLVSKASRTLFGMVNQAKYAVVLCAFCLSQNCNHDCCSFVALLLLLLLWLLLL